MKVVFMDRDGTIIVDPPDERVDKVEKIQLFPDTIESLKYLADNDFAAVIITNQAAIAEERITEEEFWKIHTEVLKRLSPSGITILKTYMDPEAAGPKATGWRKPGPNMLFQAANDLKLNLKDIYMIGDRDSDIQAAINAGCKGGIQVQTATNQATQSAGAIHSAPTLMGAVKFVVENS